MRNRFTGLVTSVVKDTVMAQVEIQAGPHRFVSLLSREAVDELGLEPGVLAVAGVKATNVSSRSRGCADHAPSRPLPSSPASCAGRHHPARRARRRRPRRLRFHASGATSEARPSPRRTAGIGAITVLAAASLTESFTTLGPQFEAAHPGVKVTFNFAASSALATQITPGAPADVFASARATTMDAVVAAGAAAEPDHVRPERHADRGAADQPRPASTGWLDLAAPDVKIALCQAQVPCGSIAEKVFANARLTVTPVTQEPDVKSMLSKVQLGEVDAGLVYVTDVLAARDKVKGVDIPADVNASTSYPIAALTGSKNPATATAFVDYVLSPDGVSVLTAAGFRQP